MNENKSENLKCKGICVVTAQFGQLVSPECLIAPTVTVLHSEQNMMIMVVTGTKDAGTQSHVSCNAH